MWRGQDHCRAMRHASQIAHDHPEAMIKGDGNTEAVTRTEAHPLGHPESIVQNVVVREHGALRKARGTGSVLDIDDIIEFQGSLLLRYRVGGNSFRPGE